MKAFVSIVLTKSRHLGSLFLASFSLTSANIMSLNSVELKRPENGGIVEKQVIENLGAQPGKMEVCVVEL